VQTAALLLYAACISSNFTFILRSFFCYVLMQMNYNVNRQIDDTLKEAEACISTAALLMKKRTTQSDNAAKASFGEAPCIALDLIKKFLCPICTNVCWYNFDEIVDVIPEPTKVTQRHCEVSPLIRRKVNLEAKDTSLHLMTVLMTVSSHDESPKMHRIPRSSLMGFGSGLDNRQFLYAPCAKNR